MHRCCTEEGHAHASSSLQLACLAPDVTTYRLCASTASACRYLNTGEVAAAADNQAPKSLYVVNVEGKRHNGPLLLGLMEYFERHLSRVVRGADVSSALHKLFSDSWLAINWMPQSPRTPCPACVPL